MNEWMPFYPCEDCETNYKHRPCQPPDMAITQKSCLEWTEYKAEIKALKRLLGYMIAELYLSDADSDKVESMLKELEA